MARRQAPPKVLRTRRLSRQYNIFILAPVVLVFRRNYFFSFETALI